jgi:hypothetical protein
MECGGFLRDADRRGTLRECGKCHQRYQFSGGMLTAVRSAEEDAPPPPARGAKAGAGGIWFGEDTSGTYDDPRHFYRGGRGAGLQLYQNEVTYEDLARADPERASAGTARSLLKLGMVREATDFLLNAIDHAMEQELFYPDEQHDTTGLFELLDGALERCTSKVRKEVRRTLEVRLRRFERARERAGIDEERVRPFRVGVGRELGRFLGGRGVPPEKQPLERELPLEGGRYRLCAGGEYQVGPPGGPRRRLTLHAFHVRRTLVTVADYSNFLERTGYPPHPLWGWRGLDLQNRPVVGVSWEDAMAYAAHHGGRLPTEAEWVAALEQEEPAMQLVPGTLELLLDDAGDPGGPTLSQGVILLGEGNPKALRGHGGVRRELAWGARRADVGFRLVLDPSMG